MQTTVNRGIIMLTKNSSFTKDLQIESEVSDWLHTNYYSTDLFENVKKIDQSDLQHKGVDVYQTSFEIFKDKLSHAVDEKCAITYVKKSHDEPRLNTFAFELSYIKEDQLLDGWLFGDKYSNTEYYQVMWLWADVSKKDEWKYNYEEINQENITRVEGMVIKKSAIQNYLHEQGLNKDNIMDLRNILMSQEHPYVLEDNQAKVQVSKGLPEKPMNVIIDSKKLKELSIYHFVQDLPKETQKIYSKTRLVDFSGNDFQIINDVYKDIKMGIKNIIFARNSDLLKVKLKEKFTAQEYQYLEDSILIETHSLPDSIQLNREAIICNGELNSEIWRKNIPFYNWDQYEIEHADFKKNISVRAGAGSGKTRTMIQRILYLVLHKDISLDEIAMITFTNDAALEMKERIEEVLFARYQITKRPLYLELLENINKINITTIDSFSKTIINQYNYKLGLGNRSRITSNIYRKREIIREVINENFRDEFKMMLKSNQLEPYELVNDIYKLWQKALSLGVVPDEFKDYQVLNAEDKTLQKIIYECNQYLTEEKKKEGNIDLYDLKFLSKNIIDNLHTEDLRYSNIKYLFVDEFQDTDNIQIDFIRTIHQELDAVLFIVGDEKQSIYRFRGAEHTAFKRIADSKDISFENFSLSINYRTDSSLLEDMNQYFERFQYLPKSKPLRAHRKVNGNKIQLVNYEVDKSNKPSESYADTFINTFEQEVNRLSDNTSLAILCRTNNEINKIAEILDENGYEGKYASSKSGDLFQRTAARDLVKFINLLLDEENLAMQLAAIDTPYFYQNMSPTEVLRYIDEFGMLLDTNHYDRLDEIIEKQKFRPFLSVLREEIIEEENGVREFDRNLYIRYKQSTDLDDEDFEVYRENYHTELNLIIEKIGDVFGSQSYSAIDIAKWLTLQINTNDKDDVPVEQDINQKIVLTTIHKSKGLEFDSVIVPVTHRPIFMHRRGFYVNYDEEEFVSNLHKKSKDKDFQKVQRKENRELLEEETRILYVAMTRAKQSLTLFKPDKFQENSFAGILKGRRR